MELQARLQRTRLLQEASSPTATEPILDAKVLAQALATPMVVVVDCISIVAGASVAMLLWRATGHPAAFGYVSRLASFCTLYGIAFFLLGLSQNLYRNEHCLLRVLESSAVLRVSVFSFLLTYISTLLTTPTHATRLILASGVLTTLLILLLRQVTRPLLSRYTLEDIRRRRVLIVGSGSEARRIFSYLIHSPDHELRPIAFLDERGSGDDRVIYSHGYRFKEHAPVHSGALNEDLLTRLEISDVFLADPHMTPARRAEISTLASSLGIQLSEVGAMRSSEHRGPAFVHHMDGLVVQSFFGGKVAGLYVYEAMKRALDIILASLMVAATLPLCVAIAVWIKAGSAGPVFFKQERIGRWGRRFPMYKFRSMYTTAPKYGRSPEDRSDPRITRAGRFLRKTSLDELPQLINVLRGEMALVGPRPEMPYVVDEYTPYEAQRLSVTPGITGFWQLSADRKFVIHESMEYDLYYIEHRGFFLDLAVLLHTLIFAMKGV